MIEDLETLVFWVLVMMMLKMLLMHKTLLLRGEFEAISM